MFDHFRGEENIVQEYKERAYRWGIWGIVCCEIAKLAVIQNCLGENVLRGIIVCENRG